MQRRDEIQGLRGQDFFLTVDGLGSQRNAVEGDSVQAVRRVHDGSPSLRYRTLHHFWSL